MSVSWVQLNQDQVQCPDVKTVMNIRIASVWTSRPNNPAAWCWFWPSPHRFISLTTDNLSEVRTRRFVNTTLIQLLSVFVIIVQGV